MFNITEAAINPPKSTIEHTALYSFEHNDFLADYRAKLLIYEVEVGVWLGKHRDFFG